MATPSLSVTTLNNPIAIEWKINVKEISVGHSNSLVGVELMCTQDVGSSPSVFLGTLTNTFHEIRQSPCIKSNANNKNHSHLFPR